VSDDPSCRAGSFLMKFREAFGEPDRETRYPVRNQITVDENNSRLTNNALRSTNSETITKRVLKWLSSTPDSSHDIRLPETRIQVKPVVDGTVFLPCKSCREWGSQCDGRQPRCTHCLDEQLMCFYVAI
jgi:hypothetical protein